MDTASSVSLLTRKSSASILTLPTIPVDPLPPASSYQRIVATHTIEPMLVGQRAAGSGQRAAGSGQRAAGSGQRAAGSGQRD